MGQIYLIRHGQASFGSDNYDELSALGKAQGRLLGEWFENNRQKFDRVVVGSMQRHWQTANACMSALPEAAPIEMEWQTDPGINEYDHHEILVRHRPDFAEPDAVRRFLAKHEKAKHDFQEIHEAAMTRWICGDYDTEYREPWPEFRSRCSSALQHLLESAGPSQSIAVFTSGGTIASMCQVLLGLDDKHTAELSWSFVNSSVTKIFYRPGKLFLSYVNNYAHLEWRGQPGSITYR